MTTAALLEQLQHKGIRIRVERDQLVVDAPKGVLTEPLRQAIRVQKVALLTVLAQTAPVRDAATTVPHGTAQALPPGQLVLSAVATPSAPWRCRCCHGTRRWQSISGVEICGRCHPPGSTALVETWCEEP